MTIRVLLVEAAYSYPPIESHHPSLSLGYIASSLRKEFGDMFQFKIINGNLAEEIKSFQPDIVGITSVTKNYNVAKEHARVAKQANLPVIIGGIQISFLPQALTRDMDVGVAGEGERTIIDVMASFAANKRFDKSELSQIEGVIYWDDGKVAATKPRPFIQSIDSIPYPARDLLVIKKDTSMLSSRGCPYNCAFCSTSRYAGNRVRYASAEYVVEEIEFIYKNYGVEYLTIYDDLFAMNSKRVAEIVELLGAKGILGKIKFLFNMRTDLITEEIAELFQQMNVHAVGLGIESGCQETLDYLKCGGVTVEDNAKAIKILKKRHIIPYCCFIIGSPYESKESILETIRFIKDNGVREFGFFVLTPYPGTLVWDYAKSRGLVSDDMDWSKLDFFTSSNATILSERMSRSEILEICDKMEARRKRHLMIKGILAQIRHPYKYIIKPKLERLKEL